MKLTSKSNVIFSILTVYILAASFAFSQPESKENHHIYLLIGQSNMAGRAPIDTQANQPLKRAFLLTTENKWEEAQNPLNRYSTIRKDIKMQKSNLGYAFAQSMLKDNKSISLGLVVNAKGGTKIEQWAKGTTFYNEAIKRTNEALKTGVLKGILWHQGEGNSKQPENYLEQLKTLIQNLRQDLNTPDCPFVAGQVFHHPETKPHTQAINQIISKLPQTVKNSYYVSSEGCTTYDNTHFDTKSTVLLGQRYANRLKK